MKYYAYLKQKGEGCDYTIGCGEHLVSFEADDDNEAVYLLADKIKDYYTGDYELSKVILFTETIPFDLKSVYRSLMKDEEKERKRLEHLKDLNDFERLRNKLER